MTGIAAPAVSAPGAATTEVALRGDRRIRAGTYPYDGPDTVTEWHRHDLHQLEYAFRGVVIVETADARYVLPPNQAVWIPAGCRHQTTLQGVRSVSVFFAPDRLSAPDEQVRVIAVPAVLREMIVHAARWRIDRNSSTRDVDRYFDVIAQLVGEQFATALPFYLPTSTDPLVSAAMTYLREHPDEADLDRACRQLATSPRTLRRRFRAATEMTWQEYRQRARLLSAMATLVATDRTVAAIAGSVGYDSVSAFTRAFTRYVGCSPSAYRRTS
jgi:AraC-like DNA-binding protein